MNIISIKRYCFLKGDLTMEVHTLTSESAVKELRKYNIRPSVKKKVYIASVIFFIIGIIGIFVDYTLLTAICFIGIAAFFFELYLISKKQIQVTVKRLREIYGTDKVEGKIIFENDKLKAVNFATNGELSFNYDVMSRFAETQNYYALFTKEYQAIVIDKQQFAPEENEQFLQLIGEKMPQLFKNKK